MFADSDLDAAAAGAHFGLYFNQGQCCCAGSRLFVEDKVHDKFVDKIAAMNGKRKLGDPLDPATEQGPQVEQRRSSTRSWATSTPARRKAPSA